MADAILFYEGVVGFCESPKEVMINAHNFISKPSQESFATVLLAMRRDLWIGETDLKIDEIKLDSATK
jgi:hypothetical protein